MALNHPLVYLRFFDFLLNFELIELKSQQLKLQQILSGMSQEDQQKFFMLTTEQQKEFINQIIAQQQQQQIQYLH